MESKLPVTVCVPVRNGGRDLAECLESLHGEFADGIVTGKHKIGRAHV